MASGFAFHWNSDSRTLSKLFFLSKFQGWIMLVRICEGEEVISSGGPERPFFPSRIGGQLCVVVKVPSLFFWCRSPPPTQPGEIWIEFEPFYVSCRGCSVKCEPVLNPATSQHPELLTFYSVRVYGEGGTKILVKKLSRICFRKTKTTFTESPSHSLLLLEVPEGSGFSGKKRVVNTHNHWSWARR